jgi:hypothetical protein
MLCLSRLRVARFASMTTLRFRAVQLASSESHTLHACQALILLLAIARWFLRARLMVPL